METLTLFGLALLGFVVVLVLKGIKVVKQSECVVVERLGKFDRVLSSGFNLIIPMVENSRAMYWVRNSMINFDTHIDLRETVLDVPEQSVITKDNVQINIDALLYIQIMDPIKATYEIANLPVAVGQLAQTTLRNVIGEMELDETLASRDTINTKLKLILDEATDKWGTKVNRVELRNIMPPTDIQQAMEKQMQAERERRAKVLEAEGDKQARISRSEGLRQEEINRAEGNRESQIRKALGEAEAIKGVAIAKREALEQINAITKDPQIACQFLIAGNYIEALNQFQTKPGDKVYMPYEASTALGTLGSVKELLQQK